MLFRLGKGSLFWFKIPFIVGHKNEITQVATDSEVLPLTREWSVLIAEDNPVNQIIAQKVVEKLGFKGKIAENGRKVLIALEQNKYDLILMDCQMPEMDGYETTSAIRQNLKFRNIPIIAMTANAMKGDQERCQQAGMDDYITKPIVFKNLRDMLWKWVNVIEDREKKSA